MADLFTHLAQGKMNLEAVQPRLKTRFEDSAFESAGEPEERLPPTDTETAPLLEKSPGVQETMVPATTGRQAPIHADHAPPTPGQAPASRQPEQGDQAPPIKPVRPAARQPVTAVRETVMEKPGAILPGSEDPVLPAAPQQQAPPREQPQIQPAPPAADIKTVESTPAPGQSPTIEVHIGRIELRPAASQAQETVASRPRFEPPLSLSAYLARRNGEKE